MWRVIGLSVCKGAVGYVGNCQKLLTEKQMRTLQNTLREKLGMDVTSLLESKAQVGDAET